MKHCLTFLSFILFFSATTEAQVSFASLGITGNGTDEGQKIQNALNSGNGSPLILTMDSGKTYYSSKHLIIPNNVTLEGNGDTLKRHPSLPAADKLFLGTKDSVKYSASGLSIAITAGINSFTFSNASSLVIGDIIRVYTDLPYMTIQSGASFTYYRHGFYGRVTNINGTQVTLEKPAAYSFTATNLRQYVTTKGVRIKNLNIDLRGTTQGYGIGGLNVYDMQISGCKTFGDAKLTNSLDIGFFVHGSSVLIDHCRAIDGKLTDDNGSVAYGYNVNGHDITVQYSYATNFKHGFTSAGRSFTSTNVRFLYDTCVQGSGTGAPMDFHAMTWGVIKGNYLRAKSPNTISLAVRSDSIQVLDNDIEFDNTVSPVSTARGIWLSEGASKNILIKNNRIKIIGTDGKGVSNSSNQPLGAISNFRVDSNYFIGCGVDLAGNFSAGVRVWANRLDQLGNAYPTVNFASASFSNGYYVSYNKAVNTTGSTYNYFFNSQKDTAIDGKVQFNEIWLTSSSNSRSPFRMNGYFVTCTNNIVHSDRPTLTVVDRYENAADSTGNKTNIIVPNSKVGLGTTPPASVACTAMSFDGTNDYVKVPDYNLTGDFTLEAWVKMDGPGVTTSTGSGGVTAVPVITKGRGEADVPSNLNVNYFLGLDVNRRVVVDLEESNGANNPAVGNAVVPLGVWTHIAATYDTVTSTWRLYVNGSLDKTADVGTNVRANSTCIQPSAIGTAINSTGVAAGYFKGSIDEVRIWEVKRSTSQIAANYNKSFTETTTGLIGYYKFNEAGTEQTVWDASPNAWHGTLGASAAIESSDPTRTTTIPSPLIDGCQVTATVRKNDAINIALDEVSSIGIRVFPNPVKDIATLSIQAARSGIYQIRIADIGGRTLYQKDVFIGHAASIRLNIPLPRIATGVLLVEVQGNGEHKIEKILKTNH